MNLVDLDHIFEKHENHVAEEARLPAERRLSREKVKNTLHQTFEVFLILEDLPRLQLLDLRGNVLHHFCEDVCLDRHIQIELDVRAVGFRDLSILAYVVVCCRIFGLRLEWVEQVLFFLQLFVNFAVDLNVLQPAMEHDQDLGVDRPTVQVGDESLKDRF